MIRYRFYYQETEISKQIIVGEKVCKKPKLTKLWKELNNKLNTSNIKTIGYEVVKEEKYKSLEHAKQKYKDLERHLATTTSWVTYDKLEEKLLKLRDVINEWK